MFDALAGKRIIALDLETTGLSPARDRVVEMAAVAWQDGTEVGHFQRLVNPERVIPPQVIRVHGITDLMVRDMPRICDILPDFLEFLRGDVLVAHNASFDLNFIDAECARCGLSRPAVPVADTRDLARARFPQCPNYRLETLKQALGISGTVAHRALADARDCLALFLLCQQPEAPALRLPIKPTQPLPDHLDLLGDILTRGGTLHIEYEDTRGQTTQRKVRPLMLCRNGSTLVLEAHCYLRDELRRFAVERIRKAWEG